MRALSVWPHYAALIASGHKTIEGRNWQTDYRGPLAIHSTKTWGPGGFAEVRRFLLEGCDEEMWEALCHAQGPERPAMCGERGDDLEEFVDRDAFAREAIIAVATVTECVEVSELRLRKGRRRDSIGRRRSVYSEQAPFCAFDVLAYGLVLEDVRRLPVPVPCTGRQGRPWELPELVQAGIDEQLAAIA